MPITEFEGKALVFNNGVKDVVQGDTSLVDENKIAHIPESNVAIDNETIIRNANNQLEVPIDEDTIYMDAHGFMKAKGGEGKTYSAGEHIIIDSENTISAEWPVIPEQKEYTGGNDIEVTSEGVINYTGSSGSSYTASEGIIIDSENTISVDKEVVPTKTKFLAGWAYDNNLPITDSFDMTNAVQSDNTWTLTINSSDAGYNDFRDLWYRIVNYRCNKYRGYEWVSGDYITKASYGNVEPFGTTSDWYYHDGEEKEELSTTVYDAEGDGVIDLLIKLNKNDNSFTIECRTEGAPGVITLEYGTTGILLPAGIEDDYLYNGTPTIIKNPDGNAILGPGCTQFVRNYEFDGLLERVNDMSDTVADLDEALATKQDTLTAGQNITIQNNVISATGGGKEYTAGANVQITSEGVISATDTKYTAGSGIVIDSENTISMKVTFDYDNNEYLWDYTSGPNNNIYTWNCPDSVIDSLYDAIANFDYPGNEWVINWLDNGKGEPIEEVIVEKIMYTSGEKRVCLTTPMGSGYDIYLNITQTPGLGETKGITLSGYSLDGEGQGHGYTQVSPPGYGIFIQSRPATAVIPKAPKAEGTYVLKAVVDNFGEATYTWVAE